MTVWDVSETGRCGFRCILAKYVSVYILHISNSLKASSHYVDAESPTGTTAESALNSWTKKMLYFCLCHSFLNCETRELKRAWPTRANDSQNAKALLRVNGQRGALAFQNKVTICFWGGPRTGRCDLWLGSALQGPSRICFLACLSCNEWDLEGFNLSAQRTNCLITFSDADCETSLFQWFG